MGSLDFRAIFCPAGVFTVGGAEVAGGEHSLGDIGADLSGLSPPGHQADPECSALPAAAAAAIG